MSTKHLSADVDYYDLLGVTYNSTVKEIQRAYRQKALTVHPDKNPSPDAAVLFHALFQAYDVLSDPQAKLAYDELLKARLAKKKKNEAMDSRRRAMKDDLEDRENTAKKQKMDEKEAEANLQTELERLRTDGARRRMEKEKELRKQMTTEESNPIIEEPIALAKSGELDSTLKIKWKRKKHNFEAAKLKAIFSNFGSVDSVAVSAKKQTALVVFETVMSAHAALTSKGTNPLLDPFDSIDWAGGEPDIVKKMNATVVAPSVRSGGMAGSTVPVTNMKVSTEAVTPSPSLFAAASSGVSAFGTIPSFAPPSFGSAPAATDDYEAITLMKMRRAERERLGRDIREKETAETVPQDEK